MSGKFCALYLDKDVHRISRRRLADCCSEVDIGAYFQEHFVYAPILLLL